MPVEPQAPRGRAQGEVQDPEERRLAGAARPDEGDGLTAPHRERDVLERGGAVPEDLADPVELVHYFSSPAAVAASSMLFQSASLALMYFFVRCRSSKRLCSGFATSSLRKAAVIFSCNPVSRSARAVQQ